MTHVSVKKESHNQEVGLNDSFLLIGSKGKSVVTTDRLNRAFRSLVESSRNGIERNSFLNWQNQAEVTIFTCQLERAFSLSLSISLNSSLHFIFSRCLLFVFHGDTAFDHDFR